MSSFFIGSKNAEMINNITVDIVYYIVAVDEEENSFRFTITEKDKSLIFGKNDSELKYGKI